MARYGYLCCMDCREHIFLGKWLRDETNRGFGFWHGMLCSPDEPDSQLLGRKVLRFIARHMDHELLAGSDSGGRAEVTIGSEEFVDADDVYDTIAREAKPQSWPDPKR